MTIHKELPIAEPRPLSPEPRDGEPSPVPHLARASATTSESSRIKRELPVREQPKRSAIHAFRSVPREPEPTPRPVAVPRAPTAHGVAASATVNAYRVIEEYMSQGQRTAAQRNAQRDGRTAMAPKNSWGQGGAQWLQLWQDMAQQWTQAVTQFVPGAGSMMPMMPFAQPQPHQPHQPQPQAHAAPAREVDIEVDTAQRTQVQLQFVSRPQVGPLKVALAQIDGSGRLALEFDAKHVRLRIPTGTAPGTYSGVVFDSHNMQCGMLTIKVSAAAGTP